MDDIIKFQPDITLELSSKKSNLVIVREVVNSISRLMGFSDRDALQLEMAVDEACANSIEAIQKQKNSTDEKVCIGLSVNKSHLRILINDSCENFKDSFEKAIPFDEHTDRTRKHGYGLQIIKTFMDDVKYYHAHDCGNYLVLTKYLPSYKTK